MIDKSEPHIIVHPDGTREHRLGDVKFTMTKPKPKKQEQPNV